MWYQNKTFWRNLMITLVVLVGLYTCTAYFALRERERQTMIHKQGEEVNGRMRKAVDSVKHLNQSMKNNSNKTYLGKDSGEDKDYYDDPDFDDLIPGEEFDEEFVDRSEGDPELYN